MISTELPPSLLPPLRNSQLRSHQPPTDPKSFSENAEIACPNAFSGLAAPVCDARRNHTSSRPVSWSKLPHCITRPCASGNKVHRSLRRGIFHSLGTPLTSMTLSTNHVAGAKSIIESTFYGRQLESEHADSDRGRTGSSKGQRTGATPTFNCIEAANLESKASDENYPSVSTHDASSADVTSKKMTSAVSNLTKKKSIDCHVDKNNGSLNEKRVIVFKGFNKEPEGRHESRSISSISLPRIRRCFWTICGTWVILKGTSLIQGWFLYLLLNLVTRGRGCF